MNWNPPSQRQSRGRGGGVHTGRMRRSETVRAATRSEGKAEKSPELLLLITQPLFQYQRLSGSASAHKGVNSSEHVNMLPSCLFLFVYTKNKHWTPTKDSFCMNLPSLIHYRVAYLCMCVRTSVARIRSKSRINIASQAIHISFHFLNNLFFLCIYVFTVCSLVCWICVCSFLSCLYVLLLIGSLSHRKQARVVLVLRCC